MLGCQHLRPFLFRVCTQQRLTTSAQSVLHQNTATKAKDSFDQATPTSEIKLISYDHELTSIYMKRLRQWHRYDKSEKFFSDLDEMKMLKITLPDEAHRLTLQVLSKVNQPHLVLRHWEQNFLGESRRILSLSDYHIIFDAISQLKKSDKALELHQQMHAQSILPDTHIQNAILRSFEDQEAFVSPERISTPINLYETWLRSGYSLQTSTLNTLLYMLRGKLSVESALRLVQKSKDAGVSLDPSIKSSLVGIMASCGRIPDAVYLANVLTLDSSAISTAYANILHGCSALDGPTILRLWNDMMIDICPLNKTLASAFLEANSRLSDPTLTKIILDRIDKEGINLTTADVNNALINFAQNGDMVGFQSTHHRYFSTTNQRTPNTETRLIEIQGYCKVRASEIASCFCALPMII